jgi:hypothetical protein
LHISYAIAGKGDRLITLCLAARYDDGVLCASDSAYTAGELRVQSPHIKGRQWGSAYILYAGDICTCLRVLNTPPPTAGREVNELLRRFWSEKIPEEQVIELLVVTHDNELHVVSSHGDHTEHTYFAAVGADAGWVCMDLLYTPLRSKSLGKVRSAMTRIFRAVERRDTGVYRPYHFTECRNNGDIVL